MLLTCDKINLTHFSSRKRYKKDESGTTVCVGYDRLLVGLRVSGRPWLESHYANPDDIVTVFMLGDKNVVFAHKKGDGVVYVNRKAGAQAMEYAKYWAQESSAEIDYVDDLPTAEHTRQSKAPKSLDDLVESAMMKADSVDCGL